MTGTLYLSESIFFVSINVTEQKDKKSPISTLVHRKKNIKEGNKHIVYVLRIVVQLVIILK